MLTKSQTYYYVLHHTSFFGGPKKELRMKELCVFPFAVFLDPSEVFWWGKEHLKVAFQQINWLSVGLGRSAAEAQGGFSQKIGRSTVVELEGILAIVWSSPPRQQASKLRARISRAHPFKVPGKVSLRDSSAFLVFEFSLPSAYRCSYCSPTSDRSTWLHRVIHFCILPGRLWNLIAQRLVWFSSVDLMSLLCVFWPAESREICIVFGFSGGQGGSRLWGNLCLEALRWEGRPNGCLLLSLESMRVIWGHGLGTQTPWIHVLALPLTRWVTLSKLLFLYASVSSSGKWEQHY